MLTKVVEIRKMADSKGNFYFYIFADGEFIECKKFDPKAKQGSVFEEKHALSEAKKIAKELEEIPSMSNLYGFEIGEIVYKTQK